MLVEENKKSVNVMEYNPLGRGNFAFRCFLLLKSNLQARFELLYSTPNH